MKAVRPPLEQVHELIAKLGISSPTLIQPIHSSNNFVYRVGNVVLKVSGLDDDSRFEREFLTLRRLQSRAPVLEVLHGDISRTLVDFPYFITKYVEGVPLAQVWEQLSVSARSVISLKVAEALRVIHALPLAGVPVFDLTRISSAYRSCVEKKYLTAYEVDEFENVIAARGEQALAARLVVTHGDLHLGNVLYSELSGDITILDFDTVFSSLAIKDLVPLCHSILLLSRSSGGESVARTAPLIDALRSLPTMQDSEGLMGMMKYFFIERICWLRDRGANENRSYLAIADYLTEAVFRESRLAQILS